MESFALRHFGIPRGDDDKPLDWKSGALELRGQGRKQTSIWLNYERNNIYKSRSKAVSYRIKAKK